MPTLPGLRYSATVSANSPLELNGIEFWVDLPRPVFERGTAIAEGGAPVALARVRAAGPVLFRGQTPALRFQDATGKLAFDIGFDQPTATTIVDRWDNAGRSFQVVQKQGKQPFQRGGSGNDQHLSTIVRCGVCDESLDRIYESFFSP